MKCNPIRWLWGLLPLALLSWGAVQVMHGDIEADLKARVDEQLKGSGFKWVRTGFSGRDGLITGTATDEADPGRAYDISRSIWGVRTVDNKAGIIEKIENYEWSVARTGNAVKLAGYVPSDGIRAEILKIAKAQYPNVEIVDEMRLARGVPSPDAWLNAVNFGLKQVAALKTGDARLSGLSLTVSGTTNDLKAYSNVKAALANDLPKGVKLVDDRVLAPVVKPFLWTAIHNGGKLTLTGFVPGERARADALAAAKAAFPRANIVDRMEVAEGAATGHIAAVDTALKQLALLDEGTADIRDQTLTIEGLAADARIADAVRQGSGKLAPSGFRFSDKIKVSAAAPKPINPFTTAVIADATTLILSGYAPTEAAREQVAQAARTRFPGRRIDNRLDIAAGASEGWLRCIEGALTGVARLGAGKIALSDRRLDVSGATDDEDLAGALPAEIKSATRADCDANVTIDVLAEAIPELVWRALYNGTEVVLEGDVSSAAAKNLLAADAHRLFPGKSVVDHMRIVETRTRKWSAVAEYGLATLADLQKGEAQLNRQLLTVSGQAANAALQSRLQERLARGLPKGYSGRNQIVVAVATAVTPPPAPAPAPPARVVAPQLSPVATACQNALQSTAREGMIRFERASATLTRESFATLNKLASVVKTCADINVEIEGHTDSEGTPERNQLLSDRRAHAIVEYLQRGGVDQNKLTAIGYGETRPLVPNDTPENRAKNRRIEFTVKAK